MITSTYLQQRVATSRLFSLCLYTVDLSTQLRKRASTSLGVNFVESFHAFAQVIVDVAKDLPSTGVLAFICNVFILPSFKLVLALL